MLRLFVAVEIPAAERAAVAALCAGLAHVKWAKPAQLHVTLRFLGATPEERLAEIRERLGTVTAPRFELALQGVGVFPAGARRPRVLWLGVAPEAPLRHLKQAIDRALGDPAPAQPEVDRQDFNPHLTLARIGGPPDPGWARFVAQHAGYRGNPWEVSAFHLLKSTLHPAGAVHETIEVYSLDETCRKA